MSLCTGVTRQKLATNSIQLLQRTQVRTVYIPPGGKSILDRRLPRKLKVGETRPPIYYKFDCKVELSDGSTVTRRSQFPKVEWRYLTDHRNNPRWNPTRTNLKAAETDAGGRMAKFQKKYGFGGASTATTAETKTQQPTTEAKEPEQQDKPVASKQPLLSDDFEDLMGENFEYSNSVTAGKVAQKRRKSKK